jgi:hypothetical protein
MNRTAYFRAPHKRGPLTLLACASALLLSACANDNNGNFDPPREMPFAELYEQGIIRYLGLYSPSASEVDGNVTRHAFGVGDGPLCLDGSGYNMATRRIQSSATFSWASAVTHSRPHWFPR